jgi:hypothetical protein
VAQPRSVGAHNTRRSKVQRWGTRVYRATAVYVRYSVFYQRLPCLPCPRGARATREEARHDGEEPGFTERPCECSLFCVLSATAVTAPASTRENIPREDEASTAKKPLGGTTIRPHSGHVCVYCSCEGLTESEDFSCSLLTNSHTKFFEFSRKWSFQDAVTGAMKDRNIEDELYGVQGLIDLVSTTRDTRRRARYHEAPDSPAVPKPNGRTPPGRSKVICPPGTTWSRALECF